MSLGINMQKRGLCGRESSEGKKRQSRIAALPGPTINLCLFQLRPWPKWCKIQAGMSSISVSSSVLFCAAWRLAMMYWFCQLCSVHSMLTWKGRVGLWREGLLVARLWLDFLSLPFSSPFSCNGLSFCLPSLPLRLTLNILSPPFIILHSAPHLHPHGCRAPPIHSYLFLTLPATSHLRLTFVSLFTYVCHPVLNISVNNLL